MKKHRFRKKDFLILFFILLTAIFIVGKMIDQGAGKIKLHLFYYKQELINEPGSPQEPLQELVDAFMKNHPGIIIETEKVPDISISVLISRLMSGNAPDIIQLQSYNEVFEFAKAGHLLDLSSEKVISRVQPEWLPAVTYNGKVYALPMDFSGIGIIYNKAMFKKLGLQPPSAFSDLKKVCSVLKSKGIIPFAGMLKANWSAGHFMTLLHTSLAKSNDKILKWFEDMRMIDDMGAIGDMRRSTSSWADPVPADTLFNIMDFYEQNLDSHAAEMTLYEQQEVFAHEEAAMMVQGLWIYRETMKTNPNLDCGFIPFPVSDNPGEVKFYADVDSTFAISAAAGTARITAARKFLAWLASKEAVRLWTEKCLLISLFRDADLTSLPAPFQDLLQHYKQHGAYLWEFCRYPLSVYKNAVRNSAQDYLLGRRNREDVISFLDYTWRNAGQWNLPDSGYRD